MAESLRQEKCPLPANAYYSLSYLVQSQVLCWMWVPTTQQRATAANGRRNREVHDFIGALGVYRVQISYVPNSRRGQTPKCRQVLSECARAREEFEAPG